MKITTPIIEDLQRVVYNLEASISDFQSTLKRWTQTSDLQLMFQKHSKMGADLFMVDAVMYVMLHQN